MKKKQILDALEKEGVPTRVQSAIEMAEILNN
jgi:hypothetical protein